ncbi:MAG TPA: ribosome biogenesis GTPase Der, partial [Roseiflexaceae bacterium]|nr:ribosome biogenesis GTPase Der [Roseiflexaceae bacterium]
EQAELAINEADVIIFLVDTREGLTAADSAVAEVLRLSRKPVILAANKADNRERFLDAVEFYALNLGAPIPMSAYHGIGTGDVLDKVVESLAVLDEEEEIEADVRIAIVGRPNVGKSSLLNRLIGQERSVVSDIPGTTRDTIDTLIDVDGSKLLLIDTAGIRRRGRIERGIEKYSVLRSLRAIERSDVALLLIDATEGVTAQDTHVAGMILDALKGVAILVNKWDLVIKDNETFNAFTRHVQQEFNFIPYAPLIFISAKTGQRVDQVLPTAIEIANERRRRIPTSSLNAMLRDVVYRHPPTATKKGAHLRLFYATQPQAEPPVFLFFTNDADLVHWGYGRYLENQIRERYGFSGTPIKVVFRSREEREDREERLRKIGKRRGGTPSKASSTTAVPEGDEDAEIFWEDDDE